MTERPNDYDMIDRAAEEIRADRIDDATARRITDAVKDRLGIGGDAQRPLTSCEDFQAEIPAYVAGTLSDARALLVGDHTRGCVPCRRFLMEARGGVTEVSPRVSPSLSASWSRPFLRVAAAIILILGGVGAVRLSGDLIANRSLRASVQDIDGSLQLVARNATQGLAAEDEIRSRQVLRTAANSGAMIRIADGSLVEMNERSEIALRASRRGTTIDLARGNIIVHAADQGDKQLFVATDDCEVAVKGTIFAVDHGLKGSRVSVIEGAVEVREGSSSAYLRPGDQVTTGDRLRRVPLEENIAWSRDAAKHKALLRELSELRRVIAEAIDTAPPRTSTFLLDLAPGDTLLYAAMPNISEDLDEARSAFYERLASSEVLAEWWQEQVVAHGIDGEIDELLDRLHPIGEALGSEAVVTVPQSVIHGQETFLFMAEVDDPSSFRDLLATLVEEANAQSEDHTAVILVEDPLSGFTGDAEAFFGVEGKLFAAAGSFAELQALARRVDDPAERSFVGSSLHDQLAETYANGVSWLLAADLAAAIAEGTTTMPEEDAQAMDRLGLLDATTVVIERHRDGEWYATNAEIRFSEDRHGIMAWLAEPAPMGSLEFVSPEAYVIASAVTKDAEEMFDDFLEFIATQDQESLEELHLFQGAIGLDLRADLAATLGGEATFALDGPVLPVPSWKLIVEVYDPGTLFHTLEQAVGLINTKLSAEGEAILVLESSEAGGRTYHTLSREANEGQAVFAAVDGYLLVAPSRALIEQAISYRDSGVNVVASTVFRDLLPDNGFADCSSLVYRDLGSLLAAIPPEAIGELEFADALSDGLDQGLVCVFAEADRITAAATGGSLVGLASTLGLCGAEMAEKHVIEKMEEGEAVSSL
jgi:ferric-dicitrate binding protein FerR (iron transport regulator)